MTQNGGGGEGSFHINGLKPSDVALLRNVASEAADQAVRRTFTTMGLDPDQPMISQTIFARLREMAQDDELSADYEWTRRTRKRIDRWGGALITAIAAGFVAALHTAWATVEPIVTAARNIVPHP